MSRMTLTRTGNREYREYLASAQWHRRRRLWFEAVREAGFEPACQVCGVTLSDAGSLDLHHISYEGVSHDPETGRWSSDEADDDLMEMCREDHMQLHERMDSRGFLGWDRRRATMYIAGDMRRRHQRRMRRHQRRARARQAGGLK